MLEIAQKRKAPLMRALYAAHRIFFFKGRLLAMRLQGDFFLEIQQMETLSIKSGRTFSALFKDYSPWRGERR